MLNNPLSFANLNEQKYFKLAGVSTFNGLTCFSTSYTGDFHDPHCYVVHTVLIWQAVHETLEARWNKMASLPYLNALSTKDEFSRHIRVTFEAILFRIEERRQQFNYINTTTKVQTSQLRHVKD